MNIMLQVVLINEEIISDIVDLPESQHCAFLPSSAVGGTLADLHNSLYHR